MLKNLNKNGIGIKVDENDDEILLDYKNLMLQIYNKLDPSIRVKLNKHGVSIIQNIYSGFDTEYKFKDGKTNELISVQLAVNTRSYLKIPKIEAYYTCKIDSLKNKRYEVNKNSNFKYDVFEASVIKCIEETRFIKLKHYDAIMLLMVEGFKRMSNENIKYYEKEDYFVVSLPRTPVEKYVYLNEDKKGYSFSDLIKTSNDMGSKYLEEDYVKIRYLIRNLIKDAAEISPFHLDNTNENQVVVTSNKPEISNNVKRYSRSLMRSLDLTINRVRNNYVIAHLTNADLCMLSDFDQLKESLDIVNKSFVTLGKPLQIDNVNVHIRDTMLLAPSGKKSLAHLGSLLNVEKIKLLQSEIESMDLLLVRNRSKFIDYAINDAVITLLYANKMEDQLFNSRSLGIPLSLSSLSASYVKDEWDKMGYPGYQVNPLYLIGDSGVTQTPKGLYATKDVGRKLSLYISNYRGGRNESFMYGVDNNRI